VLGVLQPTGDRQSTTTKNNIVFFMLFFLIWIEFINLKPSTTERLKRTKMH
jgi:hypothetical protein